MSNAKVKEPKFIIWKKEIKKLIEKFSARNNKKITYQERNEILLKLMPFITKEGFFYPSIQHKYEGCTALLTWFVIDNDSSSMHNIHHFSLLFLESPVGLENGMPFFFFFFFLVYKLKRELFVG